MAVRSHEVRDPIELGDGALAARASTGDAAAFEELYRRHAAAAWGVAQAVAANRDDAADAVSEAFTRMLAALAAGRLASDVPFRPYLLVTTRNVAIDQHRLAAHTSIEGEETATTLPALSLEPGERAQAVADAAFVTEAFSSLPERWRTVLWLTEVEGMAAREVGARLGVSSNAASQLAHRARAGLRERYLQAHLRHAPRAACARTVSQLGAYAAGGLTPRAVAAVDQHLAGCEDCRTCLVQLTDVGTALRNGALPIPIGLAAATLARHHVMFPAAALTNKGGFAARVLAGQERARHSLTVTTGAVLTAGVIAAGLMSSAGGPSPIKGNRSGQNSIASPPVIRTLPNTPPPDAAALPTDIGLIDASSAIGSSADNAPSSSVATASPSVTPSQPTPVSSSRTQPASPPPPPAPAPGPTPAPAMVQVAAGANLSVVTLSGALGVGGGCTATSVNNSSSCAPPSPSQPGVTATASTPIGTISTAKTPSATLP